MKDLLLVTTIAAMILVGTWAFLVGMAHEGSGVATTTLMMIDQFPTLFGGQ